MSRTETVDDHAWYRRLHSLDALECTQEIARLQRELKLREAELRIAIADALDPNGKPAFSNETRREAEFIRRCEENDEIKSIRDKINELQHAREKARIEAQYHADMLTVLVGGDLCADTRCPVDGTNDDTHTVLIEGLAGEGSKDDGNDAQ
jgi:hypothetical protein